MIVISYRSDGIPSEDDLVKLLKDVKKKVTVLHYGEYKYVLSKNAKSKEILLIAE
jgi:DNA adenine methylase/adenine-specific DNA-methyltransferase